MENENEEFCRSSSKTTRVIGYSLAGGLFGFVCAVVPFGLSRSKLSLIPKRVPKLAPGVEDPYRLAMRALMWATFYSVGGVGTLTVGVCWLLGVKSVSPVPFP